MKNPLGNPVKGIVRKKQYGHRRVDTRVFSCFLSSLNKTDVLTAEIFFQVVRCPFQMGNSKKDNQQTVKNKEYLLRKLASIFLAKKKSLVVKNSCESVLKGNSCDEKLNKKSIPFYSRSPDVGVIADFIEDFSNAVSVWLHKLN